jgi:hypothetical protein
MRPGQSLVSNDGQVVRRRPNSSGFDCGVGRGGFGNRRKNGPVEAAEDMMSMSARHTDPKSLGGATSHDSVDEALESLRTSTDARPGPSPAMAALRAITRGASEHSYKIRAQRAREALGKGDIAEAIRHLEAISDHATNYGRMADIDKAKAAIEAVREFHELDKRLAREETLRTTHIELRTIGSQHHVFKDGRDATGPLSREEAERRRDFLVRKAQREQGVEEIDNEIAGRPNVARTAAQEEAREQAQQESDAA